MTRHSLAHHFYYKGLLYKKYAAKFTDVGYEVLSIMSLHISALYTRLLGTIRNIYITKSLAFPSITSGSQKKTSRWETLSRMHN